MMVVSRLSGLASPGDFEVLPDLDGGVSRPR